MNHLPVILITLHLVRGYVKYQRRQHTVEKTYGPTSMFSVTCICVIVWVCIEAKYSFYTLCLIDTKFGGHSSWALVTDLAHVRIMAPLGYVNGYVQCTVVVCFFFDCLCTYLG